MRAPMRVAGAVVVGLSLLVGGRPALAQGSAGGGDSSVVGQAREACRYRQSQLERLEDLRWERSQALHRQALFTRAIDKCRDMQRRLHEGGQVTFWLGGDTGRIPMAQQVADAIAEGILTVPMTREDRTTFVRDMVRGYLGGMQVMDMVIESHLADYADRRNVAEAEMLRLDQEISKFDRDQAFWDRTLEIQIETAILLGPQYLQATLAMSGEIQEGQRRQQEAAQQPRPPAAGLRVYRGNLDPGVLEANKGISLTTPEVPQTLTLDPAKGTAELSGKLVYTHRGSIGSPGSPNRTPLLTNVQITFRPARLAADGTAEGVYDAKLEIHRPRTPDLPPVKLSGEYAWTAQPSPGTEGKIYDVYLTDGKKNRALYYRLERVDK